MSSLVEVPGVALGGLILVGLLLDALYITFFPRTRLVTRREQHWWVATHCKPKGK